MKSLLGDNLKLSEAEDTTKIRESEVPLLERIEQQEEDSKEAIEEEPETEDELDDELDKDEAEFEEPFIPFSEAESSRKRQRTSHDIVVELLIAAMKEASSTMIQVL
ncbi:uncharacterized protein LOC129313027 isoform X2 [Prosopis cineraria]|uniref:uncharacterized protein LOC129313027 isoform X2 n=1 Tax=Prosopis cineraria TaxID=364024 RepID=UPI00240EBFB4|nr:uncharacterized protein LOC129313027 isoform X2 [Prosopis cineraria]